MRMPRTLRLLVPLLILFVGITAVAYQYAYSLRFETEHNRAEALATLNASGSRLAGIAHYHLQRADNEALVMEMGFLSPFPHLRLATIANEQNVIVHATEQRWLDHLLIDSPLAAAIPLASQARASMSSQVLELNTEQRLLGVYAFQLPILSDTLTPQGTGIVVLDMDLSTRFNEAQRDSLRMAAFNGGAIALLALLLWYLLNRVLTRPIQHLVNTTRAFSDGDFSASAALAPDNELGELSTALDNMANTVQEREQSLADEIQTRQQAQARSDQLARIVENSVNEIYVSDADNYLVLNANRAARENLGYSSEESQQLMPWDFVEGLTQENIEELIAPLRSGALDTLEFETVHRRKDGSTYPVVVHLQFMRDETPPIFAAIIQDITVRNQQIEHLLLRNRAMATVDVGVIITDARQEDNPIVYTNAAIERMTGFAASEMMGRNPRFLQGDEHDQPELDQIRDAMEKAQSVQIILNNYKKDGTLFKDEVTISPVFNEDGEATHFIGVQRDVTERLDTEARLLHAQKIDAIGQLSGGIAHDFNNLLSVIIGNLEFLSMGVHDEQLREFVDEADNAAKMGARLTGRLLRFARQSTLEPTVVDVNKQVLDALELLRSTIGETISVSSSLSDKLWATRADPSEIENTVINLAINARDAMPEGGRITVETANVHIGEEDSDNDLELLPGDYIRLSVEDNGNGMSEAVKTRIFEPFFTTKEIGKGTGLGLASIYGFAKQSGGHVNVYSEVGHGTNVNVYLPRHKQHETDRADREQPSMVELYTGDSRILVVEDNDMVCKVTVKRLRALGYETLQAENGPLAVEILERETNIALILSDVVMEGGMSGYDVAAWIQKNRPGCKVLLTSGFSEQLAEETDVNVQSLHVLQKPYSLAELQQVVEAALESPLQTQT